MTSSMYVTLYFVFICSSHCTHSLSALANRRLNRRLEKNMKLVRSQKEGTNWHKSSPLSRWEGVLKRSGCLKHLDLDGRYIDRFLSFFINLDIFVLIFKTSNIVFCGRGHVHTGFFVYFWNQCPANGFRMKCGNTGLSLVCDPEVKC